MAPQETEKLFFKAKDTVNRTNQYSTNWERIFTNPTSVRGLILKISKNSRIWTLTTQIIQQQNNTKQKTPQKTKQNKINPTKLKGGFRTKQRILT